MRRYAILFALVSLLLPATVFSQTRTPEAAVDHFKKALKKSGTGDFDGRNRRLHTRYQIEFALRHE